MKLGFEAPWMQYILCLTWMCRSVPSCSYLAPTFQWHTQWWSYPHHCWVVSMTTTPCQRKYSPQWGTVVDRDNLEYKYMFISNYISQSFFITYCRALLSALDRSVLWAVSCVYCCVDVRCLVRRVIWWVVLVTRHICRLTSIFILFSLGPLGSFMQTKYSHILILLYVNSLWSSVSSFLFVQSAFSVGVFIL